jgi:hypothetical protein
MGHWLCNHPDVAGIMQSLSFFLFYMDSSETGISS